MARLSHQEMGEMVVTALNSLGGTATFAQVGEALPAEHRDNVLRNMQALRSLGIVTAVAREVDGKIQSVYSLVGGA